MINTISENTIKDIGNRLKSNTDDLNHQVFNEADACELADQLDCPLRDVYMGAMKNGLWPKRYV